MDYELDSFGYVLHVYFGGSNENATEYTGNVPSDYETLEEWAENALINAYKIVDGNLYLDITKQAELEGVYSQEHEDNRYVTHKELEPFEDAIQVINNTLPYSTEATTQGVIAVTGSDTLAAPPSLLNISGFIPTDDDFDLIVNGTNMLPNTAVTQTISGLSFTQNQDRSITLNGTGAGKNLLDLNALVNNSNMGSGWSLEGDVLTWSGTTYTNTAWFNRIEMDLPSGTYTVSGIYTNNLNLSDMNDMKLRVYNSNMAAIVTDYTVTVNRENGETIHLLAYKNRSNSSGTSTTITETFTNCMLEKNSVATVYEPYLNSIEYNLAGSSTNTKPILLFKNHSYLGDPSYYLNTIGQNIKVNMYNYDGTDITEVYSGTGGVITFTEDTPVTHITLSIPTFTEFNDLTIYPMMSLGTTQQTYETYKVRRYTVPMDGFISTGYNSVLIRNGKAYAYSGNYDPVELGDVNVNLFSGANYIYTIQFSFIIARYYVNNVALEGTTTENSGLSIDANGTVTLNNPIINNATIQNTFNIMTATIDSNYSITSSGSKDLTLSSSSAVIVGNKLSISGGNIVIGSGVSKVLISAKGNYNVLSTSAGLRYLAIKLNGTELMNARRYVYANSTGVDMTLPPQLVSVNAGDTITLSVQGYNGDVLRYSPTWTYITVEVVE